MSVLGENDDKKDKIPFFNNKIQKNTKPEDDKTNTSTFEFEDIKNSDELSLDFILSSRIKFKKYHYIVSFTIGKFIF